MITRPQSIAMRLYRAPGAIEQRLASKAERSENNAVAARLALIQRAAGTPADVDQLAHTANFYQVRIALAFAALVSGLLALCWSYY